MSRTFARLNGGAVAADVSDEFISKVFLDQRFMHAFGQTLLGKLLESAREGRFGGQLFAQGESTDAPQGPVYRQAIYQTYRGG